MRTVEQIEALAPVSDRSDRIRMLPNVDLLTETEVVELHGERAGLEAATLRNRATGALSRLDLRHLFLFIGAEPNTAWLEGCLALDSKGYIVTGRNGSEDAGRAMPLTLQTSLPRVFAIGDVRAGSTKRVASAVGEGAAVVAQIHSVLGAATTSA
ncbi:MAG TPA: NAD(P)/FAD-dependent oxidoreductase [Candidatus Cybelea sp.]|nr:NAD(P)/FAD-dependent oxidoreductase [Candidatus Cybelea sp.]